MKYDISLNEFRGELLDMLSVCFEGTLSEEQTAVLLRLANGQCFRIVVSAEPA